MSANTTIYKTAGDVMEMRDAIAERIVLSNKSLFKMNETINSDKFATYPTSTQDAILKERAKLVKLIPKLRGMLRTAIAWENSIMEMVELDEEDD